MLLITELKGYSTEEKHEELQLNLKSINLEDELCFVSKSHFHMLKLTNHLQKLRWPGAPSTTD
jgi:hypothetical protein